MPSPIPQGVEASRVQDTAKEYTKLHCEGEGGDVETRKSSYAKMANAYYDLVTNFYEFGWGQSFHFATRRKGESFRESIARHERFLASKLRLNHEMTVLDVGCGVGGPMREIARYSGAQIVGLNNNAYQIERGGRHNRKAGLSEQCAFLKSDFMKIPVTENTYDAAYQIEATAHAPDKTACYREIFRVLKPGALFGGYEWCLTNRYDADNSAHCAIKKGIEEGDGLPDIATTQDINDALKAAGFELLEARDVAVDSESSLPWYHSLAGEELSLSSLLRTKMGRIVTNRVVQLLEKLRLVPKGTKAVSDFLNVAADALVKGGETGTFTPMYFYVAKKPE